VRQGRDYIGVCRLPGGNGVEQMRRQVAMSPTAAEMWQERQRHNEALERMRNEYEEKAKAYGRENEVEGS
jgi:hypothetical protein